ncbi:XRE family transcriptional regulator [Streptococcus mutans]|uniref:replication initiation factor domain-containing protein n=1 Tax=Streptococcus mutans TaxID=1309 RepID=UPI000E4C3C74|nr:replication initiation factor domain-containing protein [Streptococcus mutans]RHA25976.1 XRE family transcriptional regulator [Streptococcus mutans]
METISALSLKQFRLSTKMNQKQFAECVGIHRRTYRAYENGERGCSYERFKAMKEKLGYRYEGTGQNLRGMIDYLRVTFKKVHYLNEFVIKYMHCTLKEFTQATTGLLSYNRVWRRGNIWLFDYADKKVRGNYQVTMQLSGQGCREMELVLEKHGLTWYELLLDMSGRSDMQVTRLDIALDEMYQGYDKQSEQIQLSDIMTKVYKDEVVLRKIRTWNHVGGGSLQKDNQVNSQGISLYFGSRQSNLYFNFYEKRYEIAKREGIDVWEALEVFGIWNRYELRLSHGKAQSVVDEFLGGVDIAEIARGILTNEIAVYDGINQYGAYKPDQKWQLLFGGTEPLQLTVKSEPYNINRTIKWLMTQVADTYAMVDEIDKLMNTEYLEMFRKSGKINDRGEQIIKDLKNTHGLEVS